MVGWRVERIVIIGGKMKSRKTAALLAIFFGIIGIHKFYMNKPGIGFVYILFSWTLIPGIVGFIEGIVYLTQTDEQFQSKVKQVVQKQNQAKPVQKQVLTNNVNVDANEVELH